MKRFHVHVGVESLDQSIAFYSGLFGEGPSLLKADYAQSEKSWIADPDGVVWEAFLTFGDSTVYGDSPELAQLASAHAAASACCAPSMAPVKTGCC